MVILYTHSWLTCMVNLGTYILINIPYVEHQKTHENTIHGWNILPTNLPHQKSTIHVRHIFTHIQIIQESTTIHVYKSYRELVPNRHGAHIF